MNYVLRSIHNYDAVSLVRTGFSDCAIQVASTSRSLETFVHRLRSIEDLVAVHGVVCLVLHDTGRPAETASLLLGCTLKLLEQFDLIGKIVKQLSVWKPRDHG